MKRVNRVFAVIIISIMVFTTACEKTETDGPVDDREKFIGTWDGQTDGTQGQRNFSLVITASNSAPDQILMQNFDGGTGTVVASVSGNLFSIPSQMVSGETIEGDGSYSNGSLTFTFTIDDGQSVEDRTGTANNKR